MIEAHRRFLVGYLDGLVDEDLQRLWEMTAGFCAPDLDVRWLPSALSSLRAQPAFRLVRNSLGYLKHTLFGLDGQGDAQARAGTVSAIRLLCQAFEAEDTRVLHDLKMALRGGIQAFERHEADVVVRAGGALMDALRLALQAVEGYYQRLAGLLTAQGLSMALVGDDLHEQDVPLDRGLPGHGGPPPPFSGGRVPAGRRAAASATTTGRRDPRPRTP